MAKEKLSAAHCILLTVDLASSANVKALHSFTPSQLDVLDPELVLRILLTYLPESLEPHEYTTYVSEIASRLYLDYSRADVDVDSSSIRKLSDAEAKRKVKKLSLLDLSPPAYPPQDALTRFLIHRAYRIDEQTGLLNLLPPLLEPFLDKNEYLRIWYISVALPMLRLQLEYYPQDDTMTAISMGDFEKLEGKAGIDLLLQRAGNTEGFVLPESAPSSAKRSRVARDVEGLVGPWIYGHTQRKRRKLDHIDDEEGSGAGDGNRESLKQDVQEAGISSLPNEDRADHDDWEDLYRWMVSHARQNFRNATALIEDWNGPADVDLGGFDKSSSENSDEELKRKLVLQYAQAAFASCYAVQADTQETIRGAHSILVRLSELLDFVPPPDLASSVEALPKIQRQVAEQVEGQTVANLEPENLLKPGHPLTTPRIETYMLLQIMVYSDYQLSSLGHPMALVNVAKLHFYQSAEEQLEVLRKILRGLSKSDARRDEMQWMADRAKLLWLWNWGIDVEDDHAVRGAGVLGKIEKERFEEEMLKVFTDTSCYDLVITLYLKDNHPANLLRKERVKDVVLAKAMEAYDSASNGNRTRGGVKKANEIIAAFKPYFPDSLRFQQAHALILATHALSFYSLTLQHSVPFQPVSIRVSQDPIGLIDKVLEQNSRSYTKLDDLIEIGRGLVTAGLDGQPASPIEYEVESKSSTSSALDLEHKKKEVEKRVTLMAIEAALREEDFETAYSYIVNRLTPSGTDVVAPAKDVHKHARNISSSKNEGTHDDISWRAAFLAGRYRPATSSPPTLRRLEQRTELLSLALLLAPTSALTDILANWRRCEEEMQSVQLSQQAVEEDFDDRADKGTLLPGNFTVISDQPELVMNQKRREMGRRAAKDGGGQAPVSMFDLTRSAASAFSRNAFPLRGAATRQGTEMSGHGGGSEAGSGRDIDTSGSEGGVQQTRRVRKRDVVANAVSGGLASGIGWVLGAGPVDRSQHEQE